jgi:hypothetical protein
MLRWLLGLFRGTTPSEDTSGHRVPKHDDRSVRSAASSTAFRARAQTHTRPYFEAVVELDEAVAARDFERARACIKAALPHIAGFVDEQLAEYGEFAVAVPVFNVGGTVLALRDDSAGLEQMREVVASRQELSTWVDRVATHEESRRLFRAIEQVVKSKPGVLQNGLKKEVGEADGRRVSTLLAWLEKDGRIRRVKSDKTYALYLTGAPEAPPIPKPRGVSSHRVSASKTKSVIDWRTIPHIALPPAPAAWTTSQLGIAEQAASLTFELKDSSTWRVCAIEAIPPSDRPDPSFRKLYVTGTAVLAFDDLGRSDQNSRVGVQWYDQSGKVSRSRRLDFGTYRLGISAMSGAFLALSKDGILHAYDDAGAQILETNLRLAPEVLAIQKRLDLDDAGMHRYCRSVALSDDVQRYMFTVVDEAWCIGLGGAARWGVSVPLREGFTLYGNDAFHPSSDIQSALDLLGLALPVTADEVKQRFRAFVKQWHPDVNRSPQAQEKMRSANAAMTVLTGLDGEILAGYSGVRMAYTDATSTHPSLKEAGITVQLGMSEVSAADWIYASAFATSSDRAYIATYSGRLLELDGEGNPIRFYSIGAVPRRICDTGDYLYVLTDTRLYVLKEDGLVALVDVSDGGDVIVGQTGFGLLENKRFRWYTERGSPVATVLTKAPIRRVFQVATEVVVETRTHRLRIENAEPWWEPATIH